MVSTMDRSSTVLTIGLVLDHAQQRGFHVDVVTTAGTLLEDVAVATLDRFCIVLLDGSTSGRAHVVAREHVVSVSMARSDLLAIEGRDADNESTATPSAGGGS